jgi:hypothetical protein
VQEEAKSRQQLLSQKDKLLQSLQMELKVYEKLAEEHPRLQQGTVLRAGPEPSHGYELTLAAERWTWESMTYFLLYYH